MQRAQAIRPTALTSVRCIRYGSTILMQGDQPHNPWLSLELNVDHSYGARKMRASAPSSDADDFLFSSLRPKGA